MFTDWDKYREYREKIAIGITCAPYPYNSLGIYVDDVLHTHEDWWNLQTQEFKYLRLREAECAMNVIGEIGYPAVMAEALGSYLDEK